MKYFTPKRYLALGNLDNKSAFIAAHNAWESMLASYQQHLHAIQQQLPVGLRRLMQSVYLHDARVLDIWQGSVSRLTITLQPESELGRLVVLCYSLVEPPTVRRGVLPESARSEPSAWLYDELDVVKPTRNGSQRKDKACPKMFMHTIMLSNGWEIRLRFRDVAVTRPVSLLPGVQHNSDRRAAAS